MDATSADMDWYLNLVERIAREGHMGVLTLVDTFGVLLPHCAGYYTKCVKERIKKPLEIHFHNHFGMATVNTVMSVLVGGEVVHTTVNGIGEASGNCPMAETVMSLLVLYGIDVGIRYDKLTELSKLVDEIAGMPANRSFVVDLTNAMEGGITVSMFKNTCAQYPTIKHPVLPRFVGHKEPEVVIGKKSGLDNVVIWADGLGIESTGGKAGRLWTPPNNGATSLSAC